MLQSYNDLTEPFTMIMKTICCLESSFKFIISCIAI